MKEYDILKVSDHVSWIGVPDHDLVTFDIVMETRYGTTYNAYFIDAEKKVLIDTVKENFWPVYREKLSGLTDPREIAFIVCTHTEPDHSGSLKYLLELAPQATVVGSGQALSYLGEMVGRPFNAQKVKDGEVLDLGNLKLRIIGAPNLHWPDTIYAYLEEDRVLFTCDSFGAHFADEKMMDDLVGDYSDAFDYYFDVILKPYSKFMLKAIEKISPLSISTICTGHGPILRSTWQEKVDRSAEKASAYLEETRHDNRVLVAYVSAYGYTGEMARQIADLLSKEEGMTVLLVDIEHTLPGDLEELVVLADGLIIGSPTINQNTLLPIYRLFSVINPIRDKGKPAAAFGSFGWSGEAVKLIEDHLANLKLNVITEGVMARFYPDREDSARLERFCGEFTKSMKETAG